MISFILLIVLIDLFDGFIALELNIYTNIAEIRENHSGKNTLNYLLKNDQYENIVKDSISWDGTPFRKQELFNSIDSLKDTLVTVKQSTPYECYTIPAKIIDPDTMLLENLHTGGYFYAERNSIVYDKKKPSQGNTTLRYQFGRNDYEGMLSFLIRGITWSPNYDLSIEDSQTCHLQGYAVIRNNHQQEYQVDHTYLFSNDLQLANKRSITQTNTPKHNSTSKSIQFSGEEKGFYFYSLKRPYTLRPLSMIRMPFVQLVPQCQFYYQVTVSIRHGENKGVFQRYYQLIPDEFLPAGIVTIRDEQILIGQAKLPDIPRNSSHRIILGKTSDVRYSIKTNLTSSDKLKNKIISRTFALDITVSNLKNKPVDIQLEFRGTTRMILDESTCPLGPIHGNTFILSTQLTETEILQCQLIITLN